MTDEELSNRIYEIMGLCGQGCVDCNNVNDKPIDFTTSREGFGLMFEFMQKHEWWEKFRNYVWDCRIGHGDWANDLTDADSVPISIISPRSFAEAMCEFFEEAKP